MENQNKSKFRTFAGPLALIAIGLGMTTKLLVNNVIKPEEKPDLQKDESYNAATYEHAQNYAANKKALENFAPVADTFKDAMLITDKSLCTTFDVDYQYQPRQEDIQDLAESDFYAETLKENAASLIENSLFFAFEQAYKNNTGYTMELNVDALNKALKAETQTLAADYNVAVNNVALKNKQTFTHCDFDEVDSVPFVTLINKDATIRHINLNIKR